jgi:hypothetical protein
VVEQNARLVLEGADKGLRKLLIDVNKSLDVFGDSASTATDSLLDWNKEIAKSDDVLKKTSKNLIGAGKGFMDFGKTTSRAYDDITNKAEAVIDTHDALSKTSIKLAANLTGLGKPLNTVNTAIGPMAGLFADVADQQSAVGKTAVLLDASEKPLINTLKSVANLSESFAGQLQGMGVAGEWAANKMDVLAKSLNSVARTVGIADTAGDVMLMASSVKQLAQDAAPEIADAARTIKETGDAVGVWKTLFGDATKSAVTLSKVYQGTLAVSGKAFQTFGAEVKLGQGTIIDSTTKSIIKLAELGEKVVLLKTFGKLAFDSFMQLQQLGTAFSAIEAMGVDTTFAKISMQLGVMGEGLIFNKEAAQEFANVAIAAFAKLEDAIAYVRTLGSAAKTPVEELSGTLQDLVNGPLKNAITSGQAADGLYNTMSAGFSSTAEASQVLANGMKLAAASGTDSNVMMETLIKTQNSFNISARDSGVAAAKLNAIVENGIVSMPQLAGGFSRVATVARASGVSFDELGGSIAALTYSMTADDALTGLGSLLQSIAGQGAESEKAIASLGIKFDLNTIKSKGLVNSLKDLYKATGGSVEKIKEVIPDTLAMTTALSLMTTGSDKAAQYTKDVANATTESLDEMFGRRMQSTMQRATSLMNGFQEIVVSFGQKLIPILEPGISFLEGMLKMFQNMPEPMKAFVGSLIVAKIGMDNFLGVGENIIMTLGKLALSLGVTRLALMALTPGKLVAELQSLKGLIAGGDLVGAVSRFAGVTDMMAAASARAAAKETAKNTAVAAGRVGWLDSIKAMFARTAATTVDTAATGANTVALGANRVAIIGQALAADLAAAKTGLIGVGMKAASAGVGLLTGALNFAGKAFLAFWAAAGPFTLIAGAIAGAFLVLQDFIPALGGAAGEMKNLTDEMDKAIVGFQEYSGEAKKATEQTRQYTGVVNNFVIPAVEGATEKLIQFAEFIPGVGQGLALLKTGLELSGVKPNDPVKQFFTDLKDDIQAIMDEPFYEKLQETDKVIGGLQEKAGGFRKTMRSGDFVTQYSKDLAKLADTQNRALSGDEVSKIMAKEGEAVKIQTKNIDDRIAALKKAQEAAKTDEQKAQLEGRIKQLQQEASSLEEVSRQQQKYMQTMLTMQNAVDFNNAAVSISKTTEFIGKKQNEVIEKLTKSPVKVFEQGKESAGVGKTYAENFFKGIDSATNKDSPAQRKAASRLAGTANNLFQEISRVGDFKSPADLQVLRDNADGYLEAIANAVEQGALSPAKAKELREKIQNMVIDVDKPGFKLKGSFLSPEQQRQIIQGNIKDQQAIGAVKIQQEEVTNEKIKAMQSKRQIGEVDAAKRTADVQVNQSKIRLQTEEANLKIMRDNNLQNTQEYKEQLMKVDALKAQLAQAEGNRENLQYEQRVQRLQRIAEIEANSVTRVLKQRLAALDQSGKMMDLQNQSLQSQQGLSNAVNNYEEVRLQNQQRLTQDVEKQAQLEYALVIRRQAQLVKNQQFEKQSQEIQIKQNQLSLEREGINNRIAVAENKRAISQVQLELATARRQKKTKEEVQLIEQQLGSLQDQGKVLQQQAGTIQKSKVQQKEIAESSRREMEYRQAAARASGQVDLQLARAKEITAQYEKQKQIADTRAKVIETLGQRELMNSEATSKILERQNQILDARKQTLDAQKSAIEGAYNIAKEGAASDARREQIAKEMAVVKVNLLRRQQEMEIQVLKIQQAQNKLALEREKIQNRIAQAQNVAEIQGAKAELEKVKATPGATPQQIKAAEATFAAAIEKGAGLAFTGKMLDQQGAMQDKMFGAQLNQTKMKQDVEMFGARMEAANAKAPGFSKRQIGQEALNYARGTANAVNYNENLLPMDAAGGANYEQVRADFIKGLGGGLQPPVNEFSDSVTAFGGAVSAFKTDKPGQPSSSRAGADRPQPSQEKFADFKKGYAEKQRQQALDPLGNERFAKDEKLAASFADMLKRKGVDADEIDSKVKQLKKVQETSRLAEGAPQLLKKAIEDLQKPQKVEPFVESPQGRERRLRADAEVDQFRTGINAISSRFAGIIRPQGLLTPVSVSDRTPANERVGTMVAQPQARSIQPPTARQPEKPVSTVQEQTKEAVKVEVVQNINGDRLDSQTVADMAANRVKTGLIDALKRAK